MTEGVSLCGMRSILVELTVMMLTYLTLKSFFSYIFSLSVSWWDVAALCHPAHRCSAVCGGVRKTHPGLPDAQPEWPDRSPEDWWVYSTRRHLHLQSKILHISLFNQSLSSIFFFLLRLHGGGAGQGESVLQHREQHCVLWREVCQSRSLQVFGWGICRHNEARRQLGNLLCIQHKIKIWWFISALWFLLLQHVVI